MFIGIGIAVSLFVFLFTAWGPIVKVAVILVFWVILFVVHRSLSKRKGGGDGEKTEEPEEEDDDEEDDGEEEPERLEVVGGWLRRLRKIVIPIAIAIVVLMVVTVVLPKLGNLTGGLPSIQKATEPGQTVVGELGEFGVVVPSAGTEKFADDETKLGVVTEAEAQRADSIGGFQVTQVKVSGQVHKTLDSLLQAIRVELEAGRELDVFVTIEVTCGELQKPECWKGPAWIRPTQKWVDWLQQKVTAAGTVTKGVERERFNVPWGVILWCGVGVVVFIFLRRLLIRVYVSRSFTVTVPRLRTLDGFEVPSVEIEVFYTRDLRPDAMDRLRELGQKRVESQIGSTIRGWLLDRGVEADLTNLAPHVQRSLRDLPRFPEVGIKVARVVLLQINYEESQERILEAHASARARGRATKTFVNESGLPPAIAALVNALGMGPLFHISMGPRDGGET